MRPERLELAKIALLSLSSEQLDAIDIDLIKRVVRQHEDMDSSVGLRDLDSEQMVQDVLDEMSSDLRDLLGG